MSDYKRPEKREGYWQNKVWGSKYIIPEGMTLQDYNALQSHWDSKLSSAGHVDIEIRSRTGQFYPNFASNKKYKSSNASGGLDLRTYTPETEEYYRLCRSFLSHADWPRLFGPRYRIMKHVFRLHTEGRSYRQIGSDMGTNVTKRAYRAKKSEFWTHWIIKPVRAMMLAWHTHHPDGLWYQEPDDAA